jgi:hypothetical protein
MLVNILSLLSLYLMNIISLLKIAFNSSSLFRLIVVLIAFIFNHLFVLNLFPQIKSHNSVDNLLSFDSKLSLLQTLGGFIFGLESGGLGKIPLFLQRLICLELLLIKLIRILSIFYFLYVVRLLFGYFLWNLLLTDQLLWMKEFILSHTPFNIEMLQELFNNYFSIPLFGTAIIFETIEEPIALKTAEAISHEVKYSIDNIKKSVRTWGGSKFVSELDEFEPSISGNGRLDLPWYERYLYDTQDHLESYKYYYLGGFVVIIGGVLFYYYFGGNNGGESSGIPAEIFESSSSSKVDPNLFKGLDSSSPSSNNSQSWRSYPLDYFNYFKEKASNTVDSFSLRGRQQFSNSSSSESSSVIHHDILKTPTPQSQLKLQDLPVVSTSKGKGFASLIADETPGKLSAFERSKLW